MTKPMKYTLCEVTRTEETESRTDEVICVGLPGLDVRKYPRLKDQHPFFEEPLTFKVGQTRQVPLTERLIRDLTNQKWRIVCREDRETLSDEERELLSFCEKRHAELEAAREQVLSYTWMRRDYYMAGFVARFLNTARIGDEIEGLREAGILADVEADTMIGIANQLSEWRSDLESKGWSFDNDGTVWEPSSGGRRTRYPRGAIRAHYRQLALQHMASASDQAIVQRIQSDLRPIFGDLDGETVREAIKYQRKLDAASTPPVPDSSE